MGEVFFGHDESGTPVAVKLIGASVVSEPGYRQRFKREVEAARAVSGTWTPAIVGADTRADTDRGDGAAPFGNGTSPDVRYNVVYGDPDIEGVPPALEPLISACLAKDPAERPGLDQIISICSSPECGTWILSQKGPTAIGGSFGCLTRILCLAATVAATVAGAKSPVPAVGIFAGLFLAWIVPWRLMVFLNARRPVTVAVMASWRGVALRYQEERVFHTWDRLDRVQLVESAVGDRPLGATHSLIVTMSPHCAGLHFPDELRPGPERKPGVNLKLTPAETLELRTMLTHHHLPRPPERSGRGR